MKILFVENHARFARIVIALFLSEHDVEVQPSVAGALQSLRDKSFDAVSIDYDLDDGKGCNIHKKGARCMGNARLCRYDFIFLLSRSPIPCR